jgi:hypothetical protein
LSEFVGLLNSHGVEYLVVGAYALAFHGVPRFTGDLDLLVRPSAANGERILAVLRDLGFASLQLRADDFDREGRVVQLGVPPNRIDLLTSITGVTFGQAWRAREAGALGGHAVQFVGKDDLIANKRLTGWPRDLADLDDLLG